MIDFGELPIGQVPEELLSAPTHQTSTLPNNSRIVTEVYDSPLTTVSVFVKAGSRYETLATSGVARLLLSCIAQDKTFVERSNALGGRLEVVVERELVGLSLNVRSEDVMEAASLLS